MASTKNLIFRQLFEKTSSTYTYLLADATTKEGLLIDPVVETAERDAGEQDDTPWHPRPRKIPSTIPCTAPAKLVAQPSARDTPHCTDASPSPSLFKFALFFQCAGLSPPTHSS